MYTVLVQGRIAAPYAPTLKKNLGADWEVLVWDPARHDPSEFAGMAARADGNVGGGIPLPEWPETPRLKIFQIPWAGYDSREGSRRKNLDVDPQLQENADRCRPEELRADHGRNPGPHDQLARADGQSGHHHARA